MNWARVTSLSVPDATDVITHTHTYEQTTTSKGIFPVCNFAVSLSHCVMNRCKYYHVVGVRTRRSARGGHVLHINISLLADVAAAIIQTKYFGWN